MGFLIVWKWDERERKDENNTKACVLNKGEDVAIHGARRLWEEQVGFLECVGGVRERRVETGSSVPGLVKSLTSIQVEMSSRKLPVRAQKIGRQV